MELLILCYVFPQWEKILQAENNQILYQLTVSLHQVLSCAMHVLPPLFQFWRYASEGAEMLDGLGRCLGGRGNCASPRHHDEGTPTSRQLNNSLPENVSRYQYLSSGKDISYNSIVVIVGDLGLMDCHIHGFEGHELQFDSCHCRLTWWTGMHTNQCTWLAEIFTPFDSMSAIKTQLSPPVGTTSEFNCGYHLRILPTSYVWQIIFRWTFEVTCMDLAIIRKVW